MHRRGTGEVSEARERLVRPACALNIAGGLYAMHAAGMGDFVSGPRVVDASSERNMKEVLKRHPKQVSLQKAGS